MSDGFAYLDILFFAAVAAFVAVRLRNVLGRRTGHERRRPGRVQPTPAPASPDNVVPLPDRSVQTEAGETPIAADRDSGLKEGLTKIRLADPAFDLDAFAAGARGAFAMIVEAFARGDKDALQSLLAPDVLADFTRAIDERAALDHTLSTELVALRAAEVAGAELRGSNARITLRFRSEQINCTRDAQGRVVDGDPSAIVEVVDLWTFERDVRSRDPNWQLVETRSAA